MIFHETALQDAWLIEPERRRDARGSFARIMCRGEFAEHGLVTDYVQQNLSVSVRAGTLRGLHFQRPPHAEAKLVRCSRGAIFDVIVDLRAGSPTYLRHFTAELSAENGLELYVPPGFAHAHQTLTDDVELTYLTSAAYAPQAEGGLRYDDPSLGIDWPLPVSAISDKDMSWPLLAPGGPAIF